MSVFELVGGNSRRDLIKRFERKSKQEAIRELVEFLQCSQNHIDNLESGLAGANKSVEHWKNLVVVNRRVADEALAGGPKSVFALGQRVRKVTGEYRISGEVRSVFTKADGTVRLVVEHTAEGGGSFLHIYGEANLEAE